MPRSPLVAFVAALALAIPATASAADAGSTYPDADWTQAWITEPDGTKLHADILRNKNIPLDADHKQPVIVSVGPYFNHSGQTGVPDDFDPTLSGPSARFADFVEGSGLLSKGYTFVMIDLRGFGGSTGCHDWGGPGEQTDVVEGIKWVAAQPWSDGNVGTYGKSYDAVTGLIAADYHPDGLKAVVAQEPVYDLYRYLFGDGMRRANFAGTPAIYDTQAIGPGTINDDPEYNVNSLTSADASNGKPACYVQSPAEQFGNDDHFSPYWRSRDLIPKAKGSDVPLFLTQGLTENNTVADGLEQYLRNHTGPERGWLGPWEHVRGNEAAAGGRLKMGRAGWFDEVLRFYDQYLKGVAPAVADPNFAVQTNDGKWRAESQWPPADAKRYTSDLEAGTYSDQASGTKTGTGASATSGVWTFSPPLTDAAHLSGSGHVSLDVRSDVPHANLAVDVYDLSPAGGVWTGPLITRQAHLIYGNGPLELDLWSADWKIAPGHRIGVRVTDTNTDWWGDAIQTMGNVQIYRGSITLPFLSNLRTDTLPGTAGVQLSSYLGQKVTLPATLVKDSAFTLPPPMQ
jgi:predicted acyl esterase